MRVFLLISIVGFFLDQVTKWLAVSKLTDAFAAVGERMEAQTFLEKLERFFY